MKTMAWLICLLFALNVIADSAPQDQLSTNQTSGSNPSLGGDGDEEDWSGFLDPE